MPILYKKKEEKKRFLKSKVHLEMSCYLFFIISYFSKRIVLCLKYESDESVFELQNGPVGSLGRRKT